MWSCWPGMTFINAVCAHSSKWMPHTRHPATGISQSVETERTPSPPPTTSVSAACPGSPAEPLALPTQGIHTTWLIGIAQVELRNYKKAVFDKYIGSFCKTYAPEHADRYWLCSVLRRASCCCPICQFWCQGIDRDGRCISSGTVALVAGGKTPCLPLW